jgi:hypothetical protein
MSSKKSQDELDLLTPDYQHVGRHRSRKQGKARLIEFAWLLVISLVLGGAGFEVLQYVNNGTVLAASTPKVTSSDGVDLSTPITVYDASGTRKFASPVGQLLLDAQFIVPVSATGHIPVSFTYIRVTDAKYIPLAKKLLPVIGNYKIKVNPKSKYLITVILGRNYKLPN